MGYFPLELADLLVFLPRLIHLGPLERGCVQFLLGRDEVARGQVLLPVICRILQLTLLNIQLLMQIDRSWYATLERGMNLCLSLLINSHALLSYLLGNHLGMSVCSCFLTRL